MPKRPVPERKNPDETSKRGVEEDTKPNCVWDDFFDAPGVDLGERDQPADQPRENF